MCDMTAVSAGRPCLPYPPPPPFSLPSSLVSSLTR
jgi:hypothetical protein